MTPSTGRRRWAVVGVLALLGAGCSRTENNNQSVNSAPATPRDVAVVDWTRCGPIECAELDVHAVPGDRTTPGIALNLYRRSRSTEGDRATLVLLGDRTYGYDARQLVSLAPVLFGARTAQFDVVSIDVRGSETSPMPDGFAHRVATLDSVDDLEVLRVALGDEPVSVIGWGTGATLGASWIMLHPNSIRSMILDTPADPAASTRRQGIGQIKSSMAVQRASVKWCAAHLSCPLNANTTTTLKNILKHLRDGRIDSRVTRDVLARAATKALAEGDPRSLFVGIADAEQGDPTTILELAGNPPSTADAQSACADVSLGSASAIVNAFTQMTTSKRILFHIGIEGPLYSACADLPPAERPLGTVRPHAAATGAQVMTIVAKGDPIRPTEVIQRMSRRMKWTHRTVVSNRHLVVGFDRSVTEQAMGFLSS